MRHWALLASMVALAALAVACGGGAGESQLEEGAASGTGGESLTQKDQGQGSVTAEATWVTEEHARSNDLASKLSQYPLSEYLVFHVKLDTHSVDLTRFDVGKAAYVSIDENSGQPASAWVSLGDDSHHREGLAVFARAGGPGTVRLALKDIAGVPERVLAWSPPPQG